MRTIASALLVCLVTIELNHAEASGQEPIIDMHLHALSADSNGPPPMAFCAPYLESLPPYDGSMPVAEYWMNFVKNPPCENPYWSPMTSEALLEASITELERLNVIGVASGSVERVNAWHERSPKRIIKAASFVSNDKLIPVDEYQSYFEKIDFRVM